jgi:hypothetical protein
MILEDAPPVHPHNVNKINRKHGGLIVSESETMQYKVVFKKRRLMHNFNSTKWLPVIISV